MLRTYQERIRYCQSIEQQIRNASSSGLQQIQDKLNDAIPESTSIFNFALPLVLSTFLMMLSFALAQFSLWQIVVQFLGLPATMTLVLMVGSSLVFAIVYVIPIFGMSKGYMVAAKAHFFLAWLTLLIAMLYFISALLRTDASFITPILALVCIAASMLIIGSQRFYSSLLFALFARVSRTLMLPVR